MWLVLGLLEGWQGPPPNSQLITVLGNNEPSLNRWLYNDVTGLTTLRVLTLVSNLSTCECDILAYSDRKLVSIMKSIIVSVWVVSSSVNDTSSYYGYLPSKQLTLVEVFLHRLLFTKKYLKARSRLNAYCFLICLYD